MSSLLLTGVCGFVGSTLARSLRESGWSGSIYGVDNLIRRGSETNLALLKQLNVQFLHADLRSQSDVDQFPQVDWVIDCAANPSVLAGADGKTSSRQLMEHNLLGTINLLERCKSMKAGFILLSTSRVYSIPGLAQLPVEVANQAFRPIDNGTLPVGVSPLGISEAYSTFAPVSLYGGSKLASEVLALEYGSAFQMPVWINRCGVLAGGGQFGRADQGIFAFWINSHLRKRPLKYIGFDGLGHQVRDALHPRDLVPLLHQQMREPINSDKPRIINVAGGIDSAMSLRQLTQWCDDRFGAHGVATDPTPRPYDLPWVVLDSTLAKQTWNWSPQTSTSSILEEIVQHAIEHEDWLSLV